LPIEVVTLPAGHLGALHPRRAQKKKNPFKSDIDPDHHALMCCGKLDIHDERTMMADKNEEIRRKVMKGVNNPSEHNPEHKARLKRDKRKAELLEEGQRMKLRNKVKRRGGAGDDGVIDTGMFGS
jgi:hypothetical protein